MTTATPLPATTPALAHDSLPPLARDVSFYGMLTTQFLGAFNDNLFKQLVLLLCLDFKAQSGSDRQSIAMALFAIPFVLFSGVAGWLADRTSKRRIIVTMKMAEVLITLAGFAVLVWGGNDLGRLLQALLALLFLMGMHSAFFGPSKYGILPEMVRERDLPQVNGLVQMTTFLAIIFGTALAGYAKDWFGGRLWVVSGMCISIAVVGVLTSLMVRRTPVARPGLKLKPSAFFIDGDTVRLLRGDRELLNVLLVSSLFWFVGGVVQPNANDFGKSVLGMSDSRTSLATACMGLGIAFGCVVAAKASHKTINFGLVHLGSWGIVGALAALTIVGWKATQGPPAAPLGAESFGDLLVPKVPYELQSRIVLTFLGFAAGLFVVPMQVFLQTRPPEDQKGRMIGAMNLTNWIGIVLSAAFLGAALAGLKATGAGIDPALPNVARNAHWVFAVLAGVMLPIALFFRPPTVALE